MPIAISISTSLWETLNVRRGMASLTWLLIDLVPLAIRGVGIVGRIAGGHLSVSLRIDERSTRRSIVLTRDLAVRRLITKRGQLGANTSRVRRSLSGLCRIAWSIRVDLVGLGLGLSLSLSSTLSFISGFALIIFLLLACLPFLANLLELCCNQTS